MDFEQALQELESLVENLETREFSLEESLKNFERGITLTRICQTALTAAEQKVRVLTENEGRISLEPFEVLDKPQSND
ncbi:MAG: exodeoxyribonuclease VII small subunit [Gammaproteobacteria bacterium]|nr:exodeoxyribonuclease VII small subunit [Gammaproteobacteria bacterium]